MSDLTSATFAESKLWVNRDNAEVDPIGLLFIASQKIADSEDVMCAASIISGNTRISFTEIVEGYDVEESDGHLDISVITNAATFTQAFFRGLQGGLARQRSAAFEDIQCYGVFLSREWLDYLSTPDADTDTVNRQFIEDFDFDNPDTNSTVFTKIVVLEDHGLLERANQMLGITIAACKDFIEKRSGIDDPEEVYDIVDIITQNPRIFTADGGISDELYRATAEAVDQEIYRENGERYYPRMIGGYADFVFARRLREMGENLCLIGEPGAGKTAFIEVAYPDRIEVSGNENIRAEDLVGRLVKNQRTDSWEWKDGPLVRGIKLGLPVYVDEIGRIRGNVLAVFNPFTDGRGIIDDPNVLDGVEKDGRPKRIRFTSGFNVVIAWNPHIQGSSMPLDLRSRFVTVNWPTDYDLAIRLGTPASFVDLAQGLYDARMAGDPIDWVPQMRHLLRARDMTEQFGLPFALAEMINQIPNDHTRIIISNNYVPRYFTKAMETQYITRSNVFANGLSASKSIGA